ncbi:N-acetyltransferase [Paraflavitalea sp. CAU 1676]|uniref:GNAT family N-acetyltransferase n=1 Tax=Paraflavitalea sp. CAU 1676 TaxID=3032598 RepID=UPI0023DC7BF6|nr:N-acetyltransferase [Paraflavitalea sp. CAU 1676]MDF2192800.1 N-acetyltransferase [Paraflavitalea sp. CAU 1676]
MKREIIIRQEEPADIPAVYAMNSEAFGQDKEAKLVDALRKNDAVFVPGLSLVATADGAIVGHILFTKIKIVDQGGHEFESLALAPMAVSKAFQKHGIGRQLIGQGLIVAKELGFTSVIVLGHEYYYPRFGFLPSSKWHIYPPFQVPANVYMAIELVEGGLQHVTGTVQYPAEFAEV